MQLRSRRTFNTLITVALTFALYTAISTYRRHVNYKHLVDRDSEDNVLTRNEQDNRKTHVDTTFKRKTILIPKPLPPTLPTRRANAAFVMLVRNKDVHGARSAIRQVEDRFNRNYQYPYVFLNDEPFTPKFKELVRTMSKAKMTFAQIPEEHWSYPEWIDEDLAEEARYNMRKIIYGWSESYRHMCRYQSGFICQHEVMLQYDYYWRIEPDVKYSCDIDFDPFLYMQDNNKKYAEDNSLEFISDDDGETYNMCHFWSNFEIVDARWMRGEAYTAFFNHLDRSGGFFYERWGDAPVHSIAAALLLPRSEIHFFREIGYYHQPFYNCPAEPELRAKCHCDPNQNINREYMACTTKFLELTGGDKMIYPEELEDDED
ncbi:alpha 1,2-mannosyltransferase 2.4.1 [Podila minutissima]|uniref:Alpha 1,2-mannosyltransferase 2.4.1 n=1 Tax=Podila minutissima TaxID=64525 RepID=A0A9P5VQ15_9FUNG|nr:alpha 1,2-mannosyltransferase 2.4.1 [Podila minutissima]